MNQSTQTRDVRNALLSKLEESNSDRTELINTITKSAEVNRDSVEAIVDQLEANGEVYIVNGMVKKT